LFDGTDLWVLDSAGPYSILYDFTLSQAIDATQLAPGMSLSFSGSEIAADRDAQALTMSEFDGLASASTPSGLSPVKLPRNSLSFFGPLEKALERSRSSAIWTSGRNAAL